MYAYCSGRAHGVALTIVVVSLCSSQTSADYQMLFPMEAGAAGRVVAPEAIKAWVNRVHARPAYKRALEKGGHYAYA